MDVIEFYDLLKQSGQYKDCPLCGEPFYVPFGGRLICYSQKCMAEYDHAKIKPRTKKEYELPIVERKKRIYDFPDYEVNRVLRRRRLIPRLENIREPIASYDREYIFERDGNMCKYCGEPGDVLDHVLPVYHCGKSSRTNLVVACRRCNSALGKRYFPTFEEKRGWMLNCLGVR